MRGLAGLEEKRNAAFPAGFGGGPAVVVEELEKRFGSFVAVSDLNFAVERGEIYGLLGPNGSGKTTTLNVISGLSQPSSGKVSVFGMDPRRQSAEVRRVLGVVPQETALYEELSAERNLAFHAELFGYGRTEKRQRIAAMLKLAQLTDRAKSRVETFSGGMKRRLAIARAMLHEPWLIYLDEPTLGVDVQSRNVIWEHIGKMKAEGRCVLLTTNYLEEANALCDRIAIIDHGELIAEDTPAALKASYGNNVVELELNEEADEKLLQKLRALPSVKGIDREGASIRVSLGKAPDTGAGSLVPRLLEAISASGSGVRHMNLREPSLDEAFLALTGRGLRD